ncbi:uncharacterized protein LOC113960203 [Corapipo altera]|uniref:uncharacterized protein LOC113960203 n=1 Tax=Corapipo altera TaxID=415028 RepID=UPI000FD642DF|nr:uncharacterized protein LOC113960203 [Corapipo altera]
MIGAGAALLCCSLLTAGALRPAFGDIARVTWRTRGTHIAEAKPGEKKFSVGFLPSFRERLLIHPNNLSLEIRGLRLEDSGSYEVVVDTSSDPTAPKTLQYRLWVHGDPSRPGDAVGHGGSTVTGHGGSTVTPRGVTEPRAGDPTRQDTDLGQPPEGRGGPGTCGGWGHYCELKGYLVAAVLGPLLVLVVTVHLVTRDKATELGDEVSAGSESPGTAIPLGSSPWQR